MNEIYITISGTKYKIKQSFRALMLFEKMTSKTIGQMSDSLSDIFTLFYCILKVNNKQSFLYSYEEFIELIDEQPEALSEFSTYLQEQSRTITEEEKKS